MVELIGTEKQISYAAAIREKALLVLDQPETRAVSSRNAERAARWTAQVDAARHAASEIRHAAFLIEALAGWFRSAATEGSAIHMEVATLLQALDPYLYALWIGRNVVTRGSNDPETRWELIHSEILAAYPAADFSTGELSGLKSYFGA